VALKKSKALPNDRKIVLNRIKPVNEIRFIRQLKYESSTIMLFAGIRYSMRDLLSDLNNSA